MLAGTYELPLVKAFWLKGRGKAIMKPGWEQRIAAPTGTPSKRFLRRTVDTPNFRRNTHTPWPETRTTIASYNLVEEITPFSAPDWQGNMESVLKPISLAHSYVDSGYSRTVAVSWSLEGVVLKAGQSKRADILGVGAYGAFWDVTGTVADYAENRTPPTPKTIRTAWEDRTGNTPGARDTMSSSGLQAGAATVTEKTWTHDSEDPVFDDWDQHYTIKETLSNEYKTQQFISDAARLLPSQETWERTEINARGLSAGIAHQGLSLNELFCSYTTGTYKFECYPLDSFPLKWLHFRDSATADYASQRGFSSDPDYSFSTAPTSTYAMLGRKQEALGGAVFTSEHAVTPTISTDPSPPDNRDFLGTHAVSIPAITLSWSLGWERFYFGCTDPGDPNWRNSSSVAEPVAPVRGLVIPYSAFSSWDVQAGRERVADFGVTCFAFGTPECDWTKVAGPSSGNVSLWLNDEATATYQNPKVGGVYQLKGEVGLTRTDAQFILPLAGAEIRPWLDYEIPRLAAGGRSDKVAYAAAFRRIGFDPMEIQTMMLFLFVDIAANKFDYIIDPADIEGTSPTGAFQERQIRQRGSYGYVTVNGFVLHGSRVNVLLWTAWGRGWGWDTLDLRAGAQTKQLTRSLSRDNPASQSAIVLAGEIFDRLPELPSLRLIPSRLRDLRFLGSGLFEDFFWPSVNLYEPSPFISTIIQPPEILKGSQ